MQLQSLQQRGGPRLAPLCGLGRPRETASVDDGSASQPLGYKIRMFRDPQKRGFRNDCWCKVEMSVVVVRWQCGNHRSLAISTGCGKSGQFHRSTLSIRPSFHRFRFSFAFLIMDLLTVGLHLRDILEILLGLDERECMTKPLVLDDGGVADSLILVEDMVGSTCPFQRTSKRPSAKS